MASPGPPERHHFGPFELQLDERRLLKDGVAIALRPRTFDVLAMLVDRADHLVTKDELLEHAWPRMVVEEGSLQAQISALRKVLGADAIATVSGQGYRFVLPVTLADASNRKLETPPRHNLRNQLTSFIGREQEIAQLKNLLASTRLITLTGAGGAGKTRLAIEVAQALLDQYPDGVWLVELASISDPAFVPHAVADALGQREQPPKPLTDTITDFLAARNLLLVLDNAEHLLDASARLIDRILQRSAGVGALVTSREPMGMAGELIYRVPSLTVPHADVGVTPEVLLGYEAVRLFVERTRFVRPHFRLTAENASVVASICSRLDGIPLAIELAAARLRTMSVEELSQRLEHRFSLLTGGSRIMPPRHRTLRSLVDWSYDLLSGAEQVLLLRASVFAGGWTLESAEKVCAGDGVEPAAVVDLLTALTDKNLVVTDEHAGTTRFKLLETVRQYANDRLRERGDEAHWRSRHFAYFTALAEEAFLRLHGHDQTTWLDRLAREHDNVRAALTWSLSQDSEAGLKLANSFGRFWFIRGLSIEARGWFSRLLDAGKGRPATRERARALQNVCTMAIKQGDYSAAESFAREELAVSRELDLLIGIAHALSDLAVVALEQARYGEAEALLRECMALNRARGDLTLLAFNLLNLGLALRARGDYSTARVLLEEAVALTRDSGDTHYCAQMIIGLGRVLCAQGDLPAAEVRLTEGVTMCKEIGDPFGTAKAMEALAELAMARNAPSRAARIWGAAERLRREIGSPMTLDDQVQSEAAIAAARAALGENAFEIAWREGGAMTPDDALPYALDPSPPTIAKAASTER